MRWDASAALFFMILPERPPQKSFPPPKVTAHPAIGLSSNYIWEGAQTGVRKEKPEARRLTFLGKSIRLSRQKKVPEYNPSLNDKSAGGVKFWFLSTSTSLVFRQFYEFLQVDLGNYFGFNMECTYFLKARELPCQYKRGLRFWAKKLPKLKHEFLARYTLRVR